MMECTTGLTDDEFDGLLAWLREEGVEGYPPILGLSGSLRATLMYLRQNIVQAVIGEILGVSQPTVSRAIKALTEALSRTLTVLLLTAEEVPEDCDYVVDGTLLPCLDRRRRRDPWSVKHGSAGMNDPDPGPARRKVRVGPGGRGSESIVIPAASAQRVGQIPDAPEKTAQVARRVVGGQHARQRHRLIHGDRGVDVVVPHDLPRGDPGDRAVDRRHARQRPALSVGLDGLVDLRQVIGHTGEDLARVGGSRCVVG